LAAIAARLATRTVVGAGAPIILARATIVPAGTTIIATWATVIPARPAIVAARAALGLRLRQLTGQRRPAREADLPVRGYLSHHHGDFIADVDDVFNPVDPDRGVLRQL
jgi:hypothetical protein